MSQKDRFMQLLVALYTLENRSQLTSENLKEAKATASFALAEYSAAVESFVPMLKNARKIEEQLGLNKPHPIFESYSTNCAIVGAMVLTTIGAEVAATMSDAQAIGRSLVLLFENESKFDFSNVASQLLYAGHQKFKTDDVDFRQLFDEAAEGKFD